MDKKNGLYESSDMECIYFMKSELKEFALEGFLDADHHRKVAEVPNFWTEM